jgi:hypothetical protein
MKTSVDLNDALFAEAKQLAAEQGCSLKAVIEDGLRRVVMEHRVAYSAAPSELGDDWPISTTARPVPGLDLTRTSELLDLP